MFGNDLVGRFSYISLTNAAVSAFRASVPHPTDVHAVHSTSTTTTTTLARSEQQVRVGLAAKQIGRALLCAAARSAGLIMIDEAAVSKSRGGERQHTERSERRRHDIVGRDQVAVVALRVCLTSTRMPYWRWLNAVMMVLWTTVSVVDGHLNLFMNETETKRLLGEYATLRKNAFFCSISVSSALPLRH